MTTTNINDTVGNLVNQITEDVFKKIQSELEERLSALIIEQSSKFDDLTIKALESVIRSKLEKLDFPESSIPVASINFKDKKLSGDNIHGGMITEFSSTGIDDRAQNCQLTILDQATIVENTLITNQLTVKSDVSIDGKLFPNGGIDQSGEFFQSLVSHASAAAVDSIGQDLFKKYSEIVARQISDNGIDLTKLTLNGKEVISGNRLSEFISESNLNKIGTLRELKVSGEALIYDTLYVGNRRVGVNTVEPSSAFSVWDEEIELQIGKHSKDIARVGTARSQALSLSSNGKDNIMLRPDGSAEIQQLKIGSQTFSSAPQAPNYESSKGSVVFNANPSLGGPMGWICLGGAKWANFGIID